MQTNKLKIYSLASIAAIGVLGGCIDAESDQEPVSSLTEQEKTPRSSDTESADFNAGTLSEGADGIDDTSTADIASALSAEIQPAATCPAFFNPSTTGGSASWRVECSGGRVFVVGIVRDTLPDGRCAHIDAFVGSSGARHTQACGFGSTVSFNWSGSGNSARVFLSVH